jgi:hypothetical protein
MLIPCCRGLMFVTKPPLNSTGKVSLVVGIY